ncbi:ABC transporter ATP-binding protein [Enterococcus rotai]|uniref:ABC transporter ATP-binding protein n=1 Tax=Enterococcus rotai TaxID=118060 RepID=UPI0032B628B5
MGYLEIKNLTFQYAGGHKPVLDDISLSIEKGAFLLICGASGSGKSTLLKMLKPQITPAGTQSGEVIFAKEKIAALPEFFSTSKIGYVMQNPENQIVTDNVWHELAFGLENMGVPSFEIKSRIAEMVHFLGIQELMEQNTSDLSGGQKQLLNLAAVLVMQPEVLLLDEPMTQLDPIASQNFVDILVRLNREMGITILLAEHSLEAVFAFADQVVVLEEGRLILADAPVQLSNKIKTQNVDLKRFILSLPSAVRLYHEVGFQGACPITVVEGKRLLARYFPNQFPANTVEQGASHKRKSLGIELKNGWFRYEKNGKDILAGVDLAVEEGEIFSLVGGNGTGKTTLLKVIAGIQQCYRGKLQVFDQPAKKNQHVVGYLPQEPQMMFSKESILEDYQAYLASKGLNAQEQSERIETITSWLDIKEVLNQHPLDLSGGECQRAALGKILLTDPKVLLLDEPTKGIDNFGKKQMIERLKKLAEQGKTILVVTHDLDFAAELSDRCGLFFQNNLLTIAEPTLFFSNHTFYTTAASRISRDTFSQLVTTEQVIEACRKKGVNPI